MIVLTRTFAIFLVAFLCVLPLRAGQLLRGEVRDTTGRAVAGASVTATASGYETTTTTSMQGTFELRNAPSPATISVTNAGFAPSTVQWNGHNDVAIVLRPAALSEQVVVAATRSETAAGDVAASLSTIGKPEIAATPALVIDNVLREVPGFSLFRRSDSRTANPTAQGVSLRGVGASGASRALVLLDGVPLNDPFGGWVYWDRVPAIAVQSVEVLRGGASALYGSGALAGVVSVAAQQTEAPLLAVDLSAGSQNTQSGGAMFSEQLGKWGISAVAQGLKTDGYIPVPSSLRGPVDTFANVRYGTGRLTVDHKWTNASAFAAGDLFNESRQNGTFLQTNDTRLAEGVAGADLRTGGGNLAVRFFGSGQRYNQTFSAIAADRSAESLTRTQAVPAQQIGTSSQWTRALSATNVVAVGADVRQVRGHTDELVFVGGVPTTHILAGGRQLLAGGFAEDMMQIGSRLHVTAAARVDSWRNYDASSAATPVALPLPSTIRDFAPRTEIAFSPSLGAVVKVTRILSLTGSGYGAFRSPTLNELYRTFRLGNVQTLANDRLDAERLWGGEAGVNIGSGPVLGRAKFFWNDVHDAIGNRTLNVTPALITRQRQNLGVLRARGVELELQASLPHHVWTRTAYQFSDSTIVRSLETQLLGLQVPQVPRHAVSTAIGYQGHRWTVTGAGRYIGQQYDDDLNQFPLPGYFSADGFVGFHFTDELEAFASGENLLDRTYLVGRTPTPMTGAPRLVRAGIRLQWSRQR